MMGRSSGIPPIEPRRIDSPILAAMRFAKLTQLRARGIPDAPQPLLPREGFGYWCAMLRYRVEQHYDALVMDTGSVGSGKSSLALEIARAIDPGHWTVPKDVPPATYRLPFLCYSPQALLRAYMTVKPGEVVVFDEGVRGLLAGDQMSATQKALIQAMALVREKGAILLVCAPRVWLIAKQIRQGRATLWIQVLRRGLALVHIRDERMRYVPDNDLPYERSAHAPYLTWTKFDENDPLWIAYLEEKHRQLDEFLTDTVDMLDVRHEKDTGHDRRRSNGDPAPMSTTAPRPPAAPAAGDAATKEITV